MEFMLCRSEILSYFAVQSTFILSTMLAINRGYLFLSSLLFCAEVLIALFMHDAFIRPIGGDFLIVILLYCLLRGITRFDVLTTAISVLTFACLIEFLQFLKLIAWLGLENDPVARTVIGTSFSWTDIVAYTLGILFVVIIEKSVERLRKI
jgi:hypothetical protein